MIDLSAIPSEWPARFVGLPYADRGRGPDGWDCWGLVRLVYARMLEVELPSCAGDYVCSEEAAEVSALLAERASDGGWMRAATPRSFDVALLRRGRYDSHVGVMIDGRRMLHMEGQDAAKVARLDDPRWSHRVVGTFRHPSLRVAQ